jgi:hypothetical protein
MADPRGFLILEEKFLSVAQLMFESEIGVRSMRSRSFHLFKSKQEGVWIVGFLSAIRDVR